MRRLLAVLALCVTPALAWWEVPHMLTASVAKQALAAAGRKTSLSMAEELVGVLAPFYPLSPDFVSAAVWADDIKHTDGRFNNWHYVDYPYLDGVATGEQPGAENLVWATDLIFDQLARGTPVPNFDNGKATGIRFMLHFIGDMHQPLHCLSRFTPALPNGDRGGNLFPIQDDVSSREDISNLHAFWDNAGGAYNYLNRTMLPDIDAAAGQLLQDHPANTFPEFHRGECNASAFSLQSFHTAVQSAYVGIDEDGVPSAMYRTKVQDIAKRQIVLGGLRLAECIHAAMAASGPFEKEPDHNKVSVTTFVATAGALVVLCIAAFVTAAGVYMKTRRDTAHVRLEEEEQRGMQLPGIGYGTRGPAVGAGVGAGGAV